MIFQGIKIFQSMSKKIKTISIRPSESFDNALAAGNSGSGGRKKTSHERNKKNDKCGLKTSKNSGNLEILAPSSSGLRLSEAMMKQRKRVQENLRAKPPKGSPTMININKKIANYSLSKSKKEKIRKRTCSVESSGSNPTPKSKKGKSYRSSKRMLKEISQEEYFEKNFIRDTKNGATNRATAFKFRSCPKLGTGGGPRRDRIYSVEAWVNILTNSLTVLVKC